MLDEDITDVKKLEACCGQRRCKNVLMRTADSEFAEVDEWYPLLTSHPSSHQ